MPLPNFGQTDAVSEHDPHSSFIKTPQQLIVVILLSFLVPIVGIILLVQLVVSHPGADPNAMTDEAVAKRLQPVGRVEFGAAGAAAGSRTGEEVYKTVCATCHQTGVAGAPKIGDKAAWAPRIKEGLNTLVADATKGVRAMPPRGGDSSLTDEEMARAVVYMANQSGAKFKEPQKPAAAADGKKVYDTTCMVCHATGVANAPKLGDKAAWAPHLKQGMEALLQSALKGKGAMPPKGGNPSLSDDEVRAAVQFMVSQSK
ncbi:MAG TPA: c-type cytochrome [Burkholderiales bacterium]|nr:c-type cytochrome [Burkholderiales bacterium]